MQAAFCYIILSVYLLGILRYMQNSKNYENIYLASSD